MREPTGNHREAVRHGDSLCMLRTAKQCQRHLSAQSAMLGRQGSAVSMLSRYVPLPRVLPARQGRARLLADPQVPALSLMLLPTLAVRRGGGGRWGSAMRTADLDVEVCDAIERLIGSTGTDTATRVWRLVLLCWLIRDRNSSTCRTSPWWIKLRPPPSETRSGPPRPSLGQIG